MSQNGHDAKIGMADDVGNHLMQLFLKQIHGYIGSYLFPLTSYLFLRFRQGALVHLLVLVQRNLFNLHRHGRHHVWRFLLQDKVVEGIDVNLLIAYNVGRDELTAVRIVESLHRGILDARELADNGLHFLQLDAETTDLHLANKLDVARWQVAHNIACTIGTDVFLLGGKWILDKYFCVFVRTVQVAEGHLRSGCPQFTQSTHRQTVSMLVDYIKPHIVHRLSDGHVRIFLCNRIDSDEDGGFRGAIAVVQLIALRRSDTGQFLARHREVQQGVVLDVRCKLIAHLCGHEGMGDVFALQVFVERHKVQAQLLRNDVYGSTARQWRIDALLVYIKAIAGILSHVVLWLQVVIFPVPVAVAHQIGMRQLAAFGNTCRSAGIEQDETVGWGKLSVES